MTILLLKVSCRKKTLVERIEVIISNHAGGAFVADFIALKDIEGDP
jgi:hypothetical protein